MLPSQLARSSPVYDTDKFTPDHFYGRFYDVAFPPYEETARHVLEIGVHHGGSVRLWHDYFESATIYGVDPYDSWESTAGTSPEDYSRLRMIWADGYDKETYLKLAVPGFDIIIDDGTHSLHHQRWVLTELFDFILPGGMIIAEDAWPRNRSELAVINGVEMHELPAPRNPSCNSRIAVRRAP